MKRSARASIAAAVLLCVGAAFMIGQGAKTAPRHLVGVTGSGQMVYRLWSDGVLEANDTYDVYDNPDLVPLFKGWKVIK